MPHQRWREALMEMLNQSVAKVTFLIGIT